MKSMPLLILALVTTLTFTACSSKVSETSKTDVPTTVAEQAATTVASETATTVETPAETQTGVYQKITAEEAKAKMDSGDAFILVDVRTEDEFNAEHIEGALLIPNETILSEQPTLLPDKNATILIYCRSGNRSQQAADKLIQMGYTQVFDFGGIIDWPYDTVK